MALNLKYQGIGTLGPVFGKWFGFFPFGYLLVFAAYLLSCFCQFKFGVTGPFPIFMRTLVMGLSFPTLVWMLSEAKTASFCRQEGVERHGSGKEMGAELKSNVENMINLDILLSDDSTFEDTTETGSCWNILQKPKALSNRESVGCSDRSQNVETSDIEAAVWERRAFTLLIISVILKNLAVWEVTAVSDSAHILFCVTVFQMPMIIITKRAGYSNFLLYFLFLRH